MIDKQAFTTGMALLAGNFGREIDGPVQRMYYAVLSPAMNTEQFGDAVRRCCAEETFWPSAAVLLDKAGASTEALAVAALEQVKRVLFDNGGLLHTPYEAIRPFVDDVPTWAAVQACGGLKAIGDVSPKRFIRAYQEALHPQPRVGGGGKPDPRVGSLVSSTAKQLSLTSGRDRAAGRDG